MIFIFYTILTCFVAESFSVDSISMSPGYEPGDRLLTSPLWYGPRIPFTTENLPGIFSPKRGDVVILSPPFQEPPGWLERFLRPLARFFTGRKKTFTRAARQEWENDFVVKRIIALPGDTVRMQGSEAYVRPQGTPDFVSEFSLSLSGYRIIRESLPDGWTADAPLGDSGDETVLGKGEYFLLSDNRNGTLDSRLWGPVNEDRIITRVLFRYWPWREKAQ
jgi:signal peptidase I